MWCLAAAVVALLALGGMADKITVQPTYRSSWTVPTYFSSLGAARLLL